MGRGGRQPHRRRPQQAEEVRAGDVPVPVGRPAHGPRAQLLHWRRHRPLLQDARLRRAAPHRLGRLRPARRERRHQAQRPSGRLDVRQHRDPAQGVQAHGPGLRLGPRRAHVRQGVLPLGPVDLPQDVGDGPGGAPQQPGELVRIVPHGARERAGHRRRVLALRQPGGKARAGAVVLQDRPITRRSCWTTWTSWTAGRSA